MFMGPPDPDLPALSGLLQHLSQEELSKLLEDDEKLLDMLKDTEQVKSMKNEREMLLARNKSLAEDTLTLEPQLSGAKDKLLSLYQNANQLYQEVEEKRKKIENESSSQKLDTVLALLQTAAAETDDETENLVSSFKGGDLDVENFLEQFMEKKKLAHLRRVKAEKLSELLQQGQQNVSSLRPAPPPPPAPFTGGAPYPVFNPAAASSTPYPLNPSMPFPTPYR